MGQILAFPSRQRGVEPPVDEVADLYESNLVAHVVGYLQRVEDRVGSAVVERLAVRLMVRLGVEPRRVNGSAMRERLPAGMTHELQGTVLAAGGSGNDDHVV